MKKTSRTRSASTGVAAQPPGSALRCVATNPEQWITLYQDGRVRLHTLNLDTSRGVNIKATFVYRPRRKNDREAIRRLIEHLNMVAAGYEGRPCETCSCYDEPNTEIRQPR